LWPSTTASWPLVIEPEEAVGAFADRPGLPSDDGRGLHEGQVAVAPHDQGVVPGRELVLLVKNLGREQHVLHLAKGGLFWPPGAGGAQVEVGGRPQGRPVDGYLAVGAEDCGVLSRLSRVGDLGGPHAQAVGSGDYELAAIGEREGAVDAIAVGVELEAGTLVVEDEVVVTLHDKGGATVAEERSFRHDVLAPWELVPRTSPVRH
ncbi:unnamed protein product, partial [Musa acuminata subsp. malaccensis]